MGPAAVKGVGGSWALGVFRRKEGRREVIGRTGLFSDLCDGRTIEKGVILFVCRWLAQVLKETVASTLLYSFVG